MPIACVSDECMHPFPMQGIGNEERIVNDGRSRDIENGGVAHIGHQEDDGGDASEGSDCDAEDDHEMRIMHGGIGSSDGEQDVSHSAPSVNSRYKRQHKSDIEVHSPLARLPVLKQLQTIEFWCILVFFSVHVFRSNTLLSVLPLLLYELGSVAVD